LARHSLNSYIAGCNQEPEMLTNRGLIKRNQEMMHSMRQSRDALRAKQGYIRNGGMDVTNATIDEWTRQIRILLKANGILRGHA
jgi:hypothetical protein